MYFTIYTPKFGTASKPVLRLIKTNNLHNRVWQQCQCGLFIKVRYIFVINPPKSFFFYRKKIINKIKIKKFTTQTAVTHQILKPLNHRLPRPKPSILKPPFHTINPENHLQRNHIIFSISQTPDLQFSNS